jgi:hypothetical protein
MTDYGKIETISPVCMGEVIFVIKGWSSFQSYKDRKPPWIRLHKSLLDNYEFQQMSMTAKAILPMLWLLASEDDDPVSGCVRGGYKKIAFRLRVDEKEIIQAVEECALAGFIEPKLPENSINKQLVTNPSQVGYETVPPETETETETEDVSKETSLFSVENAGNEKPNSEKCPYSEISKIYHQTCKGLPPAELTDDLKKSIKARWGQNGKSIDWWKRYFETVSKSDFLMGRATDWKANLPWLVGPKNVSKVLNGAYQNKKISGGAKW